MLQHNDMESISNLDKMNIVNTYYDLMLNSPDDDHQACKSSMIQHFHVMTGHLISLDEISGYVSEWRGY
jgi:hypothetical protein